jgi:hypothetical protein
MVVEAPAPPAAAPDSGVDGGVIEDARRRQRRHRLIGFVFTVLAACSLAAGIAAGGGGSGSGGAASARSSGGGHGPAAAHAGANPSYPGAPTTQPNGYGVPTNTCPLARPSRCLPARAGCVFVRRVDMTGDGRRDLVIVYSTLSRHHAVFAGPVPAAIAKNFVPLHAYLKVVQADGTSTTVRVHGGRRSDTAAIDFVTHIGGNPGDEIFLRTFEAAGANTDVAYGWHSDRLVAAGPLLDIGADGGSRMRFSCLPGHPPRLATSTYVLIGLNVYGWWHETRIVYRWREARLVRVARQTFRRHGYVKDNAASFRTGCPPST